MYKCERLRGNSCRCKKAIDALRAVTYLYFPYKCNVRTPNPFVTNTHTSNTYTYNVHTKKDKTQKKNHKKLSQRCR